VNRRAFIAGLGGAAAAWPLAARAQQGGRVRRIGVLMNGVATETEYQAYLAAFVQGLRQLGWVENQNIRIDVRWSGGDAGLARIYAAQLIGLMPDVIFAVSTTNLTAIQQASSTMPVVFVQISDPVAQGFVANVTQPGGNFTGFSAYEFSIGGKWLELLKEAAPDFGRVSVMFNPDTSPQSKFFVRVIEAASPTLGMQSFTMLVRTAGDIEPALESFARQPNGALIMPSDSFTRLHQPQILDLAVCHCLPSIGAEEHFAKDGGLMEYAISANTVSQFGQAATYVDRILKGSKPGDLPVQAPIKYRLAINLKTAKALRLTVPETLLATADEVIQ
jgi:putative tryptophan/tyrosine transport system substrate-binding protein